jgi:hypothetical protein
MGSGDAAEAAELEAKPPAELQFNQISRYPNKHFEIFKRIDGM